MAYFFHANEIAKSAVEIERKGRAFYMRLVSSAQNEKTAELFKYLADEEAKHEQIFQGLMDRLGTIELPAWASQEEYSVYLESLIEGHALFSDERMEKGMAALQDEKDAIRMAMGFEKDTLLFFSEMENLVPESERDAVRACKDEERQHLSRLQKMLNDL